MNFGCYPKSNATLNKNTRRGQHWKARHSFEESCRLTTATPSSPQPTGRLLTYRPRHLYTALFSLHIVRRDICRTLTAMDDSFDEGASSDFAPTKPVKATKPKAAPKKAAGPPKPRGRPPKDPSAKPKAAPKKKKVVSDDENSDLDMNDDAFDDDESLLADTPPKQKKAPGPKKTSGKVLADIANESFSMDGAPSPAAPKGTKAGGASGKYQMLTHLEHIMKRPDTYIGSTEKQTDKMWVYNSTTESMEYREVTYVPGLYKIFDEILVNAADNKQNDKNMDEIRVSVDRETGEISVRNNGKGIPIEIHKVCHSSPHEWLVLTSPGTRHLRTGNDFRPPPYLLQLRRRPAEDHRWSQRLRSKALQRFQQRIHAGDG